jgi:hypothetical protein
MLPVRPLGRHDGGPDQLAGAGRPEKRHWFGSPPGLWTMDVAGAGCERLCS